MSSCFLISAFIPSTNALVCVSWSKIFCASEYSDAQKILDQLTQTKALVDGMNADIKKQLDIDTVLYKDFKKYEPSDKYKRAYLFLSLLVKSDEDWAQLNSEVREGYTQYYNMVNYNLNMDYDPRHIVGDNYE